MLQHVTKFFKSDARLSYLTHVRYVLLTYLLGSLLAVVINWFIMSFTGGQAMPLSFTLMYFLGALFLALPVLFAVLLVLLFFRRNVEQYLIFWCIAAVIIVPLAWMTMEFLSQYAGDMKLADYLFTKEVISRALLIGVYAACCSFLYYRGTKRALTAI